MGRHRDSIRFECEGEEPRIVGDILATPAGSRAQPLKRNRTTPGEFC